MELRLDLPIVAEKALREQAALTGQDMESIVIDSVLKQLLTVPAKKPKALQQARVDAFRRWMDNVSDGNPNADFSRSYAADR